MKALEKKHASLTRKLERCSEFLRGSITSTCSTCNRAACICTGNPVARAYRLTFKDASQKTRTVYIPHRQLSEARRLVSNYAKVRKLMEELQAVNVELFREASKAS